MIRIGGLFEGYGGLTKAARAVFGGELAWVSEYEPPSKATPRPTQAAARLLAHRHPGVPNLGDITAIDWPNVEPVDVLVEWMMGLPEGWVTDGRSRPDPERAAQAPRQRGRAAAGGARTGLLLAQVAAEAVAA